MSSQLWTEAGCMSYLLFLYKAWHTALKTVEHPNIYIYSDMFEYIRNQVSLGPGHVLIHPEYYDAHRVEKRQFKMSILMIHTPGTIPFKMDFQDFKPTSTTNYWARYKVLSPLQKKVKRLDSCMVHRIFTYIWLICMVNVRNIPVPWILSEML